MCGRVSRPVRAIQYNPPDGSGEPSAHETTQNREKRMRKRIVIGIVLVLLIVGAYFYFSGRNGRNPGKAIQVSGNIELTEVNIAFKTSGKLIERTVDEGDVVKKGQVIARLDRDQLLAQREREAAGLNSAISQLAQAETSLAWQKENTAGRCGTAQSRPQFVSSPAAGA